MKKVLIICLHRADRSPGQRYRYEQYIPYLEQHGYRFTASFLLNASEDKAFYSKGKYFRKAIIYFKSWLKRTRDWMRMNRYDIIFVYRDALVTGSTFFEKRFSRSRARLIYDFDDAIWLQKVSEANRRLSFLKKPGKTSKLIGMADLVFAGNQYLADYAMRFNSNTVIIPSTIDMNMYRIPAKKEGNGKICIGWTGSMTTVQHFETAIPALKRIQQQFKDQVYFKIIGDPNYYCEALGVQGIRWNAATEVEDLSELDIGIMPLPDDEWSKGKCGMKGLQYMALGIPTLMSPVGVNREIIQDGVNGFLPSTEDEWVSVLSELVRDERKRKQIGQAGRETIIRNYSVDAVKDKYLEQFNRIMTLDKSNQVNTTGK